MPDSLCAPLSPLHNADDDSGVYQQVARPKTIGRPRHAFSGHDLDAACTATGTPTTALASAWGISETVARGIRSGEKPLTWDRVTSMPRTARRALLTAALDALDDETPSSRAAIEVQVLHIHVAVGELAAATRDALLDGVIEDDELPPISRAASRVVEAATVVALRPRGRR